MIENKNKVIDESKKFIQLDVFIIDKIKDSEIVVVNQNIEEFYRVVEGESVLNEIKGVKVIIQ